MNIYSLSSLTAAIVCLSLALFVLVRSGRNSSQRAFSAVTALIGAWTLYPFLFFAAGSDASAKLLTQLAYVPAAFVPPFFFSFMMCVIELQRDKNCLRILRWSYLLSALFLPVIFTPAFIVHVPRSYHHPTIVPGPAYLFFIAYFGVMYFYASARLLHKFQSARGFLRNQLRYVGIAFVIAFTSGIMHFLTAFDFREPFPHDWLVVAYTAVMAYAIFRYRLMDTTVAFTRTTIFLLVYMIVLGLPFALAVFFRQPLIAAYGGRWWMAPLVLMAVLATVGPFIYIYLESKAEEALLKEQRRYQQTLKQASVGMTRIRNLQKLLELITHIVTKSVRISFAAVYLLDVQNNEYVLQVKRDSGRLFLPKLGVDNHLILRLFERREPLVYEELKHVARETGDPVALKTEECMKALNAAVVIPSFLEERLLGLIVLGEKRSGQMYTPEDLSVFQVLASQAALAIENAQFYEEAKEMQEQIAQAEKMATIGTMADGLSHQINNRFYALSLIASDSIDTIKMTNTQACSPEVKEMVETVSKALERIQANVIQGGEVVKGILKYTRKGDEGFESLSMDQILDGTLDMIQFKIRLSELDIVRDYAKDAPKIHGNLVQLQEVFFNFIDNAYDAIMERRMTLKEQGYRGRITISMNHSQEGVVTILIADNGMGVKEQNAKKVFTPFFTTKTSSRKGTGLGLYVIRRIITETHKGTIDFRSEHRKGTCFSITLPVSG